MAKIIHHKIFAMSLKQFKTLFFNNIREALSQLLNWAVEPFGTNYISQPATFLEHIKKIIGNNNKAKKLAKTFIYLLRWRIPNLDNNIVLDNATSVELNLILSRLILENKDEFDNFLREVFTQNSQSIINEFTQLWDYARRNLRSIGQFTNVMIANEIVE